MKYISIIYIYVKKNMEFQTYINIKYRNNNYTDYYKY